MQLRRLFTAHPASVGETYLQHLCQAARFGGRMVLAGVACLIHALLPFIFVRTARNTVEDLHMKLVVQRSQPSLTAGRHRASL